MPDYSYADCLEKAYTVNWRIEDVLGKRTFDASRPWLPAPLSATERLGALDADDRRRLTQVELAAYAHLFGYVEEFIAPQMVVLAGDFATEGGDAFDALTNFAAEEVKHMRLFLEVRKRVDAVLGFETELLGGREETARFVLSKDPGAVLLLTTALEWMSQRHFREAIRDDGDLDPLTRDVFRAHWQEESQHARMDHLETLRAFEGMDAARRDRAAEDLVALLQGLDGLLGTQAGMDLRNFERLRGAPLDAARRAEVAREILRAKRWTFIGSAVTHPRFQELYLEVTTEPQRALIGRTLEGILGGDARVGAAA